MKTNQTRKGNWELGKIPNIKYQKTFAQKNVFLKEIFLRKHMEFRSLKMSENISAS